MALFWQKGNKKEVKETAAISEKTAQKKVTKTPVKTENKPTKKALAKTDSVAEKRTAAVAGGVVFPAGGAVIKARITEKSGMLAQNGVYTFEVLKEANSRQIAAAIKEAYKVTPVKVSVSPIKSKQIFSRGKKGRTNSGKKAFVYLKEGEKIEFI